MEPYRPLLLVRADANTQIGSGHVLRCAALAEAWLAGGGRAEFLCRDLPAGLQARLHDREISLTRIPGHANAAAEIAEVRARVHATRPAWLVFDGYAFDHRYQQAVRQGTEPTRLLWIDDADRPQLTWATVVLNQNIFAEPESYPTLPPTDLLLGPRYALLRPEFRRAAPPSENLLDARVEPNAARPPRILLTLGGGDAGNATALVLRAIQQLPQGSAEVVIALGVSNPHRAELEKLAASGPLSVRIEQDVRNMAELMAGCQLAIAAAGTTSYELAAVGLPALLLVTAENQRGVAQGMDAAGAARDLGDLHQFSSQRLCAEVSRLLAAAELRAQMASVGQRLVDGCGATRVATRLLQRALRVRPATAGDAELLYRWQLDAAVRAASFTAGPADFASHQAWLNRALGDPRMKIELFEYASTAPVGCVRFALDETRATIGVVVDAAYRGRQLASELIRQAVARLAASPGAVHTVQAWIKPTNLGSRRAFAAAGFTFRQELAYHEQPAELWEFPLRESTAGGMVLRPRASQRGVCVHD